MALEDWFLLPEQRGNPSTDIDRRHDDGMAWSEGNDGAVLIDGAAYFRRLHEVLCECRAGDWLSFTDWQGDPDELLDGPGTEIGALIAELAARGVNVRGLLWRSHPEAMNFGEAKNLSFSRAVNDAGGEVLLDHRVRRGGSHHQKLFVVRRADPRDDVAFVGGIDLCHGRRDDHRHLGDPQAVHLDDGHYGEQPPWHDLQLELRGPAVDDLAFTFAERWQDPTPIDARTPVRAALHRWSKHPDEPGPVAPSVRPPADGPLAVQVLRTYPELRDGYPFAEHGERSIARAYLKAFAARAATRLPRGPVPLVGRRDACARARRLARSPALQIVVVVPRYPDPDGRPLGGGEPHRSRAGARRAARCRP